MPRGPRKVEYDKEGYIICKPCKTCGVPIDRYNWIITARYPSKNCKECFRKRKTIYEYNRRKVLTADEKEKQKQIIRNRMYQLKAQFGMTPEDYNKKLALQLNGCEICKQPCSSGRALAVDHDHKTGKIRGLLCHKCNRALGQLNEDENIIWNMLEYLKKYNIKVAV